MCSRPAGKALINHSSDPQSQVAYLTTVVILKTLVLSEHLQNSKGGSKNEYHYKGKDPWPSSEVKSLPGIFASLKEDQYNIHIVLFPIDR